MISKTINELLDSEATRGLKETSQKDLARYLGVFDKYCTKHKATIKTLTPDFFVTYMLTEHSDKNFDNKKSHVWALRKFGAYLHFTGRLPSNVTTVLHHPKKVIRPKLPEYLSEKEMRQLLTWCYELGSKRDFAIVSLLCCNGLRPHDLANVKRSQYNSQGAYFDGLVKGHWVKRTPLSDNMVKILDDYLETRTDDCDALFVNKQNRAITKDRVRDAVKKCAEYAGLEREVTPRILRHTFATHFSDRHNTILCGALLGHAHSKTTKVYAHLSPSYFRPLMNRHPFVFGAIS